LHTASIPFLLVSMVGCIAVERNVRRDMTSGAGEYVTARGQWQVEQEWQCRDAPVFALERERAGFDRASAAWLEDGWELAQFDVVSLPGGETRADRVCLVGTFRRWATTDP
jgi:hypothetical protein